MSRPRAARDGDVTHVVGVAAADPAARLVAALTRRGLRIAVAESLTGGLLVAELVRIPGASAVVNGAVVAYATAVKHSLLGVDAALLEREGAVHPEVARQMAAGARTALAVDGRPADLGVATTGVAGPDWQDGRPPGTVYLGIADDTARAGSLEGPTGEAAVEVIAIPLELQGDRAEIRTATVHAAIEALLARIESPSPSASTT